MKIEFALSKFRESKFSKIKMGTKSIDVVISGYSNYKDGILLVPAHASLFPNSPLFLVESDGLVKEVFPVELATDPNAKAFQKIDN